MSIAFRKKDHQYDGDDIYYDDALGDVRDPDGEDEEEAASYQEFHHKATAMPIDWVMDLYSEMKSLADFQAVEIFDRLDPTTLAEFVGSHTSERVFN